MRVEAHPLPHGAHEVYVDEAFAFWREHAPRGVDTIGEREGSAHE